MRTGFVLHMQPILDLATGQISHGELLLRMRGEHGDLIPPGAFLPAAERYGLIHAVDRWVVRRAIRMIADAGDHRCRHSASTSRASRWSAIRGCSP